MTAYNGMDEIESENWVLEIGQYISLFAQVEKDVYELIDCFPQDKLTKHAISFRDYSDRVRMLQALLRSTTWDRKIEIEEVLEDTILLGGFRNKLAHNPTYYEIYVDPETEDVITKPAIYDSKKGHRHENITYKEILKRKHELIQVSSKLQFMVRDIKNA